jgi:hypothetical protein
MHEKFIFERNIQHFLTLLDSETDLDRVRLLERLLDAELDGLAALEARTGMNPAEGPHGDLPAADSQDSEASQRRDDVGPGSTPLTSAPKP